MINLNGKWSIVLVYGPEYGEDEGKEVYCEATLKQIGSSFNGDCIDIGGTGVSPDIATIRGFIEGNEISFVKQYPSLHYSGENGETIVDKSSVGPEINYFGTYLLDTGSFFGDWDMVVAFETTGYGWIDQSATGTWTMKRT